MALKKLGRDEEAAYCFTKDKELENSGKYG